MSTGTQPVLDIENTGAKASPDWIQSTTTNTDLGNRKDEQPEDSLVELKYRSVENVAAAKFAKGLGLFSIALGLAEVLASRQLGELAGLNEKHSSYLPLLGAREIAHGLGILKSTKPTAGVWTRVGGDAIDLASAPYNHGVPQQRALARLCRELFWRRRWFCRFCRQ